MDIWNAFRSDAEIRELAEAWVTRPDTSYAETDQLYQWLHKEPEKGLATICAIAQIAEAPEMLAHLSAGPLEDFLCIHGEQVFETVRRMAHEQEQFRALLRGVWQLSMSNVFYQKIRALGIGRL